MYNLIVQNFIWQWIIQISLHLRKWTSNIHVQARASDLLSLSNKSYLKALWKHLSHQGQNRSTAPQLFFPTTNWRRIAHTGGKTRESPSVSVLMMNCPPLQCFPWKQRCNLRRQSKASSVILCHKLPFSFNEGTACCNPVRAVHSSDPGWHLCPSETGWLACEQAHSQSNRWRWVKAAKRPCTSTSCASSVLANCRIPRQKHPNVS